MDKNQFIGLILMFALLAVYFTWFAPEPPVVEETPTEELVASTPTEQTISERVQTDTAVASLPDSLVRAMNVEKYGALSFASIGEEEEQIIENEELKITFTSKGGKVKHVVLKNHKDYLGNPLVLVDDSKSQTDLFVEVQGKNINLSELSFSPSITTVGDTTEVTYSISNGSISLEQRYTLAKSGFELGYNISSNGLSLLLGTKDVTLQWNHDVTRAEQNLKDARTKSNVRYYAASDGYNDLKETSTEYEEETIGQPIKWITFKQKFFTAGLIANTAFKSGYANQKVDFMDTSTVKSMSMTLAIPSSELANGFGYRYYFGTNNYSILKEVAPDFEENLDMGWGPLPFINKFLIIPLFHFFEGFLSNYGIIILIVVVIIRLGLSPLTYKSHISMAKMRVMKPELDEIKEKHDGDMQKAQQEQMKLYQQVGINPISGCIPQLLQMPILFSLFFFFPNAVELRQQSFLWAHDLSTYDSILNLPFEIPFYGDHVSLFTLLMTASTILITWKNSEMTTVQGPMKTVQYIMPITFLFFLNSYASGLTFYYFISNLVAFSQTLIYRKVVDEEKIHKTLQENKKKNATKKKSKFQSRLEEAMKANQEAQKKGKGKKKK